MYKQGYLIISQLLYFVHIKLLLSVAIGNLGKQRRYLKTFKEPGIRFQGIDSASLCSLVSWYDNPIPNRFLTPIDCSEIQH